MQDQSVADRPTSQGHLLEVGQTSAGLRRIAATTERGTTIAAVREMGADGWLVIPVTLDAPSCAARFDIEADALEWLTYIAKLHTGQVTA
ncbi:hypothetical protein E2F47_27465 [Mycobacterium eburneum]|nr:hypothetical protein [Mycobacterium eburneum]TDH45999.1 hypothetical protein E2F47_27465 [Mycobacterium eburneum]